MTSQRFTVTAMSLMLAALLWAPALAQNPGKQNKRTARQGAGANVARMSVRALDALLNLSADQEAKITAIQDRVKVSLAGLPRDPSSRAKRRELLQKASEEIGAVLTDEQKTKLKSGMQSWGPLLAAGIPPAALEELKLTDEQKKKIADILAQRREKMRNAAPQTRKALADETKAKIEAVLTAEQKTIIAKYREQNRSEARRKKRPAL